jgi:hypothetical protein
MPFPYDGQTPVGDYSRNPIRSDPAHQHPKPSIAQNFGFVRDICQDICQDICPAVNRAVSGIKYLVRAHGCRGGLAIQRLTHHGLVRSVCPPADATLRIGWGWQDSIDRLPSAQGWTGCIRAGR